MPKKTEIPEDEIVLRIVEAIASAGQMRNDDEHFLDKGVRLDLMTRGLYLYEYGRRLYPEVKEEVERYFKRHSPKKIIEVFESVDQIENGKK